MRSIGIILLLIGGFVAYLGVKGKIGPAWDSLRSGKAPAPLIPDKPPIKGNTTNQSPGAMT